MFISFSPHPWLLSPPSPRLGSLAGPGPPTLLPHPGPEAPVWGPRGPQTHGRGPRGPRKAHGWGPRGLPAHGGGPRGPREAHVRGPRGPAALPSTSQTCQWRAGDLRGSEQKQKQGPTQQRPMAHPVVFRYLSYSTTLAEDAVYRLQRCPAFGRAGTCLFLSVNVKQWLTTVWVATWPWPD